MTSSAGLDGVGEIAAAPRLAALGAEMPARFGGPAGECRAVRERAGVFDAAFRAWLRVRGEDRAGFLQGMLTNDVKKLAAGQGCYAALLNQQGKLVSDLRVYAAAGSFLLDLPRNGAGPARAALERLIVADDVQIEPEPVSLVGLEGPRAPEMSAALGVPLPEGGLALVEGRLAGTPVLAAAAANAGEAGVVFGCAPDAAASVWAALRAAGAEPVGMEALDVLRVEAGIPWLGVDMDEEMLVMEVGLDDAISFSKGCYLGQEVVERIAARGHVNRRRVGLRMDGAPVPAGAPVRAEGRDAGWVTSSVVSPLLGATIGMGYVRRELAVPGTPVTVGEDAASAWVAELPFYSRKT